MVVYGDRPMELDDDDDDGTNRNVSCPGRQ